MMIFDLTQLDRLLGCYPALLDLPPQLRRGLGKLARPFSLPRDRVAFDLGSPCTAFMLLTAGSIRVAKPSGSGRELVLYRVSAGDLCVLTLSCLLQNQTFIARGIVESEVSGVMLPGPFLFELVDQSQAFRLYLFRFLARHAVDLAELVETVAFASVPQRLAALLGAKGTRIAITHQMLADELGSSREVISRTLETFEEQGLLVLERGQITILDRSALLKFTTPSV